jgi:hypothetical protein
MEENIANYMSESAMELIKNNISAKNNSKIYDYVGYIVLMQ